MLRRVFPWVLASALSGAALVVAPSGAAQVQIQFRLGGRDHPLRGRQFETMRSLAHYLDDQARQASDVAGQRVSYRPSSRRVASALSDFASRTSRFHERMDAYLDKPWDVPRELDALDRSAVRVSALINRERTSPAVVTEWNDAVDVLNRMKSLLAGNDVEVPPAHGPRRGYVEGYGGGPAGGGSFGGGPVTVTVLAGADLQRFRSLVRELDDHLGRVRDAAGRYGRREYESSRDVFANIEALDDESSRLRQRAEADQIDPREIRPTVDRLSEMARRTDESMRRDNVLPGVRSEWQQSIATLDQMTRMLP